MVDSPKTRWRSHSNIRMTSSKEIETQVHHRMDVAYYMAKDVLIGILDELRHDTSPTIEGFMENIDFMLDHPNLIFAAKQTWIAAQKEVQATKQAALAEAAKNTKELEGQ